ncbi:thiamine-phosphate kinase [Leptospira perolatii]|uniref:Thiamine-monophosphate kinase n=1 Tax=Leptospira perolatii TaxID=2023191 RepID=A0A2M9ZKL7_9LEPT|nr:thiamine-phosphate kinase [Leptospira perolatii]PJZ69379.1 thiamine-phosphate kinase [Leptospira perolatii]PJZ72514.1 thiamine-phosphate kinase [Leptospira perolatii]
MKEEEIIRSLYPDGREQLNDCYLGEDGILITTDTIVEETHFRLDWSSPADIASKLVEVNVSDIVAANGLPTKAFFNFGLSSNCNNKDFLNPFLDSFRKKINRYEIELCGGDTYRSHELNLTLTLLGKSNSPLNRVNGKAGDKIYLSGHVGSSFLGYKILKGYASNVPEALHSQSLERHLRPTARIELVDSLLGQNEVHSCMDLTDGLVQDLSKLSKASNLVMEVNIEQIPHLPGILDFLTLEEFLSSGEELELIVLSSEDLPSECKGIPVTQIGTCRKVEEGETPNAYFHLNGKTWIPKNPGFLHFA